MDSAQNTRTVSTTKVIGTTTDDLGHKTTVTETTTVTFSTAKNHEGEFLGATSQTAVHSGGAAGDVIAQSGQVSISQKEAAQGMGTRAFTDAQQSAVPNLLSQLASNFRWSWKDTGHTAAAVGLGALGVGCAIGEPCGVLAGVGAAAGVVEGGAAVKDALDEGGH